MPADLATLSEKARSSIRDMIVHGELAGGQWLRKRDLAKRLSMSATPVVEAFRRLEQEGLVETQPQWGTRVRTFTVAQIHELSGMRLGLECFVARTCAERSTTEQLDRLAVLAAEVDRADQNLFDPTYAALRAHGQPMAVDVQFHRELAEQSQLLMVVRELDRLRVLEATCRLWLTPGIQTRVSHAALVDTFATRNPAVAEAAMRQHIQDSVDAYIPFLRSKFGDGPIVVDADGANPNAA